MKHEFKIIADLIENNSRVIDVGCGTIEHLWIMNRQNLV